VTIRHLEALRGAERVALATPNEVRQALEQAGADLIEGGVRRRRTAQPGATGPFEELRSISLRSTRRPEGYEQLTEVDLYDGNGLPA
jgi:hypothetical protein